jgi:hypothetical protein
MVDIKMRPEKTPVRVRKDEVLEKVMEHVAAAGNR